ADAAPDEAAAARRARARRARDDPPGARRGRPAASVPLGSRADPGRDRRAARGRAVRRPGDRPRARGRARDLARARVADRRRVSAGPFRYVVVDVFTDTPLQGNQLAVFTDARGLPEEALQPLAREVNFSETVFV